jgi:hypothetical protein
LAWRLTEKVQQVDQRPAQAIDGPCRNHVNVAPSDGLEQAIEARPLVAALGAGDTGILENSTRASHGAPLGPAPKMPATATISTRSKCL